MKQSKAFYIKTICPIHVGSDEVYEPTSFTVDQEKELLISFDPVGFIRGLNPRDKQTFAGICQKGTVASLIELYQFMNRKSTTGEAVALCKGFMEHYGRVLAMRVPDERRIQQELNRFIIARTAFNPYTGKPYLPGSAVKGAIRTAYLNRQAKLKPEVRTPHAKDRNAAKTIEKDLLDGGTLQTDPFRLLKVSDFMPVGDVQTRIVYAVNEKKEPSKFKARGPYQILEIIPAGAVFQGTIQIEAPQPGAKITSPLTAAGIFEGVSQFYRKEKYREDRQLMDIDVQGAEEDGKGLLLRLGRHSGAEALTIEGHRNIRIMQGGGKPATSSRIGATTFWLAAESSDADKYQKNQLRPFGWVSLGEITEEIQKDLDKKQADEEERMRVATASSTPDTTAPPELEPEKPVIARTTWEGAQLAWTPGNQELTATFKNSKAKIKGKDLVPESMHKPLFEKRKIVTATVIVEPVGNAFKIVGIEVAS